MSQLKYLSDLREVYKRMKTETDPKVIQEHTCPLCGGYGFKQDIEAYGMCWEDYEFKKPRMAAKEKSAMAAIRRDLSN